MEEQYPEQLDKYRLDARVGRGGMSDVFRATDTETGLTVALKLFRRLGEQDLEAVKAKCEEELIVSQKVDHPNIIKVFGSGEVGEHFYFTMEFIQGESLSRRLRRGPELSIEEKLEILMQAALGLGAAHRQKIVHRDIKPGNIMLTYDAQGHLMAKITDFGIAADTTEVDLAGRRQVPGTPKYLAPEIIKGTGIDGRSDIFALGVTAYETFAGVDPFKADESSGYLKANLEQTPPALTEVNVELPAELDALVARMLEKDPEERYTAASLARDVARVQTALSTGEYPAEYEDEDSAFYVGQRQKQAKRLSGNVKVVIGVAAGLLVLAGLALGAVLMKDKLFGAKPGPVGPSPSHTKAPAKRPAKAKVAVKPPESPPKAKAKTKAPEKPTPPVEPKPDPVAIDLQRAAALVAAGELEKARTIYSSLLEKVQDKDLQADVNKRIAEIDDQRAKRLYQTARSAFRGKRRAECRVLCRQLAKVFPGWSAKAEGLLAEIDALEAKEREQAEEKRRNAPIELQTLLAKTEYMIATEGAYRGVIDEFLKFAKDYAGTPQSREAVKRAGATAVAWQKRLSGQVDLTEADVQAFAKAGDAYAQQPFGRAMKRGLADVLLALVKTSGARGQRDVQTRALMRLKRLFPRSPQANAAAALAVPGKPRLKHEPPAGGGAFVFGNVLAEPLQKKLANPAAWRAIGDKSVHMGFNGEALVVSADYAYDKEAVRGYQTIPFGVRSVDATVEFCVPRMARTGIGAAARVVFEVNDSSGQALRVYFDGNSYGRGLVRTMGGQAKSFNIAVTDARGDEGAKFHTLRLKFDKLTGEVHGFVDKTPLGSIRLRGASDLRVGFFVSAVNHIGIEAQFRNFRCTFGD